MVLNTTLLFFITGLLAASCLPALPSSTCLALVLLAGLVLLLLYSLSRRRRLFFREPWLYGAALWLGVGWAIFYGQQMFMQRLPDHYASEDFLVEGSVINLPEQTERGERFDLQVERVLKSSVPLLDDVALKKLRLNSYEITPLNEFRFQPGQRWRLWLRLKPPRGMVNPWGFDYEGWLLQEGYSAVGYVRTSPENIQLADASFSLKKTFDHWGFASLQWINTHIDNLDQRALFAAIALGYKEEFTRHHWDLLKNTGTIHLVVVSGLNIVLAASAGYFLFAWLFRLLFFPLRLLPAPVWGALGAIVLAVFYAGMTGLSLPTQRSLVMVLCGLMTLLLRCQLSVSTGFLLALTLVLILDPLAAFTASLWLSFGAVAILLYGFAARIEIRKNKWDAILFFKQWIYTQAFVSLGIFPLIAYWMGSVPLVMPLANLLAVPWATFVLMPLTIISGLAFMLSASLGDYVLQFTGWGMDLFWWFLKQMQEFNHNWYMVMGNTNRGDTPSLLSLVFAIFGIIVVLAPCGVVSRFYGVILLLPLLYPMHHPLPAGEFELTVVDVGQGLGILIETENKLSVYDVGDRYSDQFDIGRDVMAQLVRRKGYDHLDSLVVSHSDSDHAGGLKGLLAEISATRIFSGNAVILQQRLFVDDEHRFDAIMINDCINGQRWTQDQVQFEVLSPDADVFSPKRNNRSCVIKISNAHFSVLLTGDIEASLEYKLLSSDAVNANPLKADVLVAPHHGSKTSSSPAFLQAVDPGMALVSVGYKSQYGHPHREVVERYRERGISFWRTDQSGALIIRSDQSGEAPHELRSEGFGYWRRW